MQHWAASEFKKFSNENDTQKNMVEKPMPRWME